MINFFSENSVGSLDDLKISASFFHNAFHHKSVRKPDSSINILLTLLKHISNVSLFIYLILILPPTTSKKILNFSMVSILLVGEK